MFTYKLERELQDFLIERFGDYFNCSFVTDELVVKAGKIDLVGEDANNVYLIELKRDIVTTDTIKQLEKYVKCYKTSKNIIGIAAAPNVEPNIDLSEYDSRIKTMVIHDVLYSGEHKVLVSMSLELLKQIDDYQFNNRFKSRNEAIRELIQKGLEKGQG